MSGAAPRNGSSLYGGLWHVNRGGGGGGGGRGRDVHDTSCWLPLLSAELQPLPVEAVGHTFPCHFLAAAAGVPACQNRQKLKLLKYFP